MKAYLIDLRQKIIDENEKFLNVNEAQRLRSLSWASLSSYSQYRQTGEIKYRNLLMGSQTQINL